MLKTLYKICEEVNGNNDKRYTVKYINSWFWPFWQPLTNYRYEYEDTVYFTTYEEAVLKVADLKAQDKAYNFKRTKCTIIK